MENYYEKNLVINGRELSYDGIFILEELLGVINRALEQRGYKKQEKKTEETVTEAGRTIYLELRPFKVKTEYMKYMIKIKLTLSNLTESVQQVDGYKRKFNKSRISIIFDAWLLGDYSNRWGMSPFVYFMKGLINKYLYTFPLEKNFSGEISADTAYIHSQIKNYLAEQPGQSGRKSLIKEEEVKKKTGEEVLSEAENL
ncbi:MAG TPA: hypothetical protein VJC39_01190 [Candidatus Nanoarchaeia archaeon]|nr:hypothetical protein [Candidatus Nanoarchaeia archaeon]